MLGPEKEFVKVFLPVVVEAFEAIGGEADGSSGCKVETARVEEIEEGILEDFSPYLEVLKFRVGKTTDDSVGNVTNTRSGKELAYFNLKYEESR